MADYVYIPTGKRVSVADGKQMPPALFAPAEGQKAAPKKATAKPKAAPRKRAAKPKEQ